MVKKDVRQMTDKIISSCFLYKIELVSFDK